MPKVDTAKKAPQEKRSKTGKRKWSRHVAETSDALDLQPGIFAHGDAAEVARSLKRSAERSDRRKSSPFRSAMSMLVYYINRAGSSLGPRRRKVLERAKDELRKAFDRPPRKPRKAPRARG